ncbi:MAG: transposase [Lachnospiraceae bacterium]|nr:transposase [Lachnospiraceae bacterium]
MIIDELPTEEVLLSLPKGERICETCGCSLKPIGREVVSYAQNQKPFMENYLLDGRCSLSNNAAENAIRPFVTGRKNWLFADTPNGADASATVYSLIVIAKANGLDVFSYLQELLANMTSWDYRDEYLEDLMPWSEFSKGQCCR